LHEPARLKFKPLVFAEESFRDLVRELVPLFKLHHREVALDRDLALLDPDWDCFYVLEERGVLHVLTARHNGRLVGYIFNNIGPHIHYRSTVFGQSIFFWLHPRFRRGWEPVKMLLENKRLLADYGVVVATINFKIHFQHGRVGKLLKRIGYEPSDIVMRMRM